MRIKKFKMEYDVEMTEDGFRDNSVLRKTD
jgi:hypothetical protein